MTRKNGKAYLALALAVMLLFASFATVSARAPGMVAEGPAAAGLVPDDWTGRAAESIRSAEFLKLAVGLHDVLKGGPVPELDEAAALARAYELGLIAEPETNPDGAVTRQEAYVVLVRLIDRALEQADVTLHAKFAFEDEWRIAGEGKAAVDYLYHHGMIGAPGTYVIAPHKELLVEEAAALIRNVYAGRDRFAVQAEIPDEWEWHIEPVYDGLGPDTRFSNGLAAVSKNGKYGYIDRDGQVAIEFQYDRAYDFSEGRARVVKDNKTGYIDREGNVIVPLIYEKGGDYSEEHVWLFDGEAYGYADKYGHIAIPLQYEYAYDFKEGVAPVKRAGKYGYIDRAGATVIPFQYEWASPFSEGMARTGSRGSYNYIDKTGEIALEVNYDYLFDFADGRAIVFNRDQYAVVDREGEFIIPFGRWGFIFGFHDGLSMVHGDAGYEGNYTYINTNGDIVIGGVPFHDANDFSEGLAAVATHTKSTNKVTRSYVTRDGQLVLPRRAAIGDESPHDGETFYLQSFSEGLAAVVNWEGKLGFVANPLLKRPVRGEAALSGADRPSAGAPFALTYSLQAASHVSAQEVTVTYNSDILQPAGEPEVLAEHTIIASSDTSEPGTLRFKLATLGADHAIRGGKDILKLHFQALAAAEPGTALATVRTVLADGRGNEWPAVPAELMAVDRTALQTLVASAEQRHGEAVEGSGQGQYAPGAKLDLQTAIDAARGVLENGMATQAQLDTAVTALQAALAQFEGKRNSSNGGGPPPAGHPPVSRPPASVHELGTVAESDGATILTVSADKLKAKLGAAESDIVADLTGIGDSLSKGIELSPELLQALNESGITLILRTGETDLSLPAGALRPDGTADPVRIVIADRGTAAGAGPGMQALTRALQATVQAGGRTVQPAEPLELIFRLDGAGGDWRKAGVYALTLTGQWEYAGGRTNGAERTVTLSGAGWQDAVLAVFIYSKTFDDIAAHWAKDAIEVLASRHIVFGADETRFAPQGQVSRAEFAALAVRALGLEPVPYDGGFSDVDAGAWYADVLAAAFQAGLMQGDGDGKARPTDRISRQEMAVMLLRLSARLGLAADGGAAAAFADGDRIAPWAAEAVAAARQLGLVQGKSGNRYAPLDRVTRAEAAQVLYRLLERNGEL